MTVKISILVLLGLAFSVSGQPVSTNATQVFRQRVYRVDTNSFALMRQSLSPTNNASDIQVLRTYLKERSVDISPPSTLFYTYGEKSLIVCSTTANLDGVERILAELRREK